MLSRLQHVGSLLGGLAALLLLDPAHAQLRVPSVPLPALPLTVPEAANRLESTPALSELTHLRAARVRALLRANRHELDRDDQGAAVIRGQVLVIDPSESSLRSARDAGFEVFEDRMLPGLALHLRVLRAPADMSTTAALQKLRTLDPAGSYDFNHVFDTGNAQPGLARTPPSDEPVRPAGPGGARPHVGLIDAGIDVSHPVFDDAVIHTSGCDGKAVPSDHGTAVASILVGHSKRIDGVMTHAELFAVDVYCGRATGGAVDAIVSALEWLAQQRVGVINISLVGPRNLLLERAVEAASRQGHIIVAAVGNDGPAAPPLYPAAYAAVIGVTGVDEHDRVLPEACRGPQVSFAAPGLRASGAAPRGAYRPLRGTSFAAPIVAGLLAMNLPDPEPAAARADLAALIGQAFDLGAQGKDYIYGNGLVGAQFRH